MPRTVPPDLRRVIQVGLSINEPSERNLVFRIFPTVNAIVRQSIPYLQGITGVDNPLRELRIGTRLKLVALTEYFTLIRAIGFLDKLDLAGMRRLEDNEMLSFIYDAVIRQSRNNLWDPTEWEYRYGLHTRTEEFHKLCNLDVFQRLRSIAYLPSYLANLKNELQFQKVYLDAVCPEDGSRTRLGCQDHKVQSQHLYAVLRHTAGHCSPVAVLLAHQDIQQAGHRC